MSEDLKLEYTLKELVDVITIPTKAMRYALKQIYGLPDLTEDIKYVFRNGQRKLVNGVDQISITSPYGFELTNDNFETYLLKAIRRVINVNTWLPADWVLPVKPVEPEEPVDPIEPEEPEPVDPIEPEPEPTDPVEPPEGETETPDPIDPPTEETDPEEPTEPPVDDTDVSPEPTDDPVEETEEV